MEFQFDDGYRATTQPNPPYGIRVRLFNPKGKLVKKQTFPLEEEEHWVAELIYSRYIFRNAKWKCA